MRRRNRLSDSIDELVRDQRRDAWHPELRHGVVALLLAVGLAALAAVLP